MKQSLQLKVEQEKIKQENVRDMLKAGISLERIESILGDSNSVRNIASRFIKKGGSNEDIGDLDENELKIAKELMEKNPGIKEDQSFFQVVFNAIQNDSCERYNDPIYLSIMRDPVVLSSGVIMDRSSIHDE